MAMEEPHDSVLHDATASILEEFIEVKYKSKKSRLEPLKIQNSIDGRPNKANDVDLADDKGDIMQKKEKEILYNIQLFFNHPKSPNQQWDSPLR